MNRREFLQMLGAVGLVAAVPAPVKFIFDPHANLWRQPPHQIYTETFDHGCQEGMAIQFQYKIHQYRHAVISYNIPSIENTALMKQALLDWKSEKLQRLKGFSA